MHERELGELSQLSLKSAPTLCRPKTITSLIRVTTVNLNHRGDMLEYLDASSFQSDKFVKAYDNI